MEDKPISNEVEYARREIRNNGYLSALQIVTRLSQRKIGINKNELDSILSAIPCQNIQRVEYTNSYVSSLKFKYLYYYNPKPTPDTKPKRRKKVSAKDKTKILQSS